MDKEIIIDVSSDHVEIAQLKNNQLIELNKDSSSCNIAVGDIYLGKVRKIMPSLNAAFVNVGYGKDAFIHYLDLGPNYKTLNSFLEQSIANKSKKLIPISRIKKEPEISKDGKIADLLKPGQSILVQIAKEPISTKGPRLTSEISIAGRNMVLLPFGNKISISQRIKSKEERVRLKKLVQSIIPKGFGVIIRTACEGVMVAELDREIRKLVTKWNMIAPKLPVVSAPSLLVGEMDRSIAMIRDIYNDQFGKIYVNDQSSYEAIKCYIADIASGQENNVKLYKGEEPIFSHFGITSQIKSLFGRTVSIKRGAYLIIEHTEAFHVVDVNSGNRSKAGVDQEQNALEVNMSAAEEVARQLRLRDLGGIIVVDFIDMSSNENRKQLYQHLKDLMAEDKSKHNILPLSKFCLMQITRQRVRPEIKIDTSEVCPSCNGTGKVNSTSVFVDVVYEKLEYISTTLGKREIHFVVNPLLYAYLTKGIISKRRKWSWKLGSKLFVKCDPDLPLLDVKFYDKDKNLIVL